MPDDATKRKRKGPSPNIGLQQRIPVKQLVYTPKCVTLTLVVFGILCLVIGIICTVIEASVTAYPPSGPYTYFDKTRTPAAKELASSTCTPDGSCSCPCTKHDRCPGQASGDVRPCLVQFELSEDLPGPVYFYYTLENFYQNNMRVAQSHSALQARGEKLTESATDGTGFPDCAPYEKYSIKKEAGEVDIYYYPCGLLARSMFNDTFSLRMAGSLDAVAWETKGIARNSGGGPNGRNQPETHKWHRENCFRFPGASKEALEMAGYDEALLGFTGNEAGRFDCWHNISDEAYQVWTRPAARPHFWKLHRRIPNGLPKGKYELEIGLNFPVANFSGTKGFYFTNATPMGASRPLLSAIYLAVGSVLLVAALAFAILMVAQPGPLTKPTVKYAPVTVRDKPKATGGGSMMRSISRAASSHAEPGHEAKRACIFPSASRGDEIKFESNFVTTSRYTVATFIPLNLYIQFQRLANCYFLLVACLASTPLSPLDSSTYWMPLIFVLGVSALKDANEDWHKHKSDAEENARPTWLFDETSKSFKKVPWRAVTVGDLVMITTSDDDTSPMIPSDLVLLASSAPDGTAFLETMNLDGETNLKLRESLEVTHTDLTKKGTGSDGNEAADLVPEKVARFKGTVVCNPPDNLLYDFSAKLQYNGEDLPLNGGAGSGQFLQRSAKLRNTKFIVGMAVYTGKETKIQMNMTEPPVKVSNIERRLNTYILGIFGTLFVLCCAGAISNSANMNSPTFAKAWYLAPEAATAMSTYQPGQPALAGTFSWFSHLILLSLLVPISLYVTVEMVKLMISILIQNDREMYAVEEDQVSLARSMGLCEELGQVNYIFSDKTGTLTQNLMEFKKCSIAGEEYGRGYCEVERAIARRQGRSLPDDPLPPAGLDKGFNFVDERLLFGNWQSSQDASVVEDFLVNMALNHNVQVEYSKTGEAIFQAESPDEGAFVTAARNMGFFFSKREIKDVLIKISPQGAVVGDGPVRKYTIRQWNPFDNNRKRTSLVVETEEGALVLLVKGADTSVMPFIDQSTCPFYKRTMDHINRFGEQGLRTLVFAGRRIDPAWYQGWNELYKQAALLPDGRETALRQLACHIEEDHSNAGCQSVLFDPQTSHTASLRLHGVTALEDKLQENVGQCISQLAKAMIKIWVLTGDKLETAINIGEATALLDEHMKPFIRMSSDDMTDPPAGWEAKATAAELRLDALLTAAKARDLTTMTSAAAAGKNVEGIASICETVERKCSALVRDGALPATVQLEVGVLESQLRDALIRERVHCRVLDFERQTQVEKAGGYALVIDGPCLRAAVAEECKMDFLKAAIRCKAVVCCRVTPAQKAAVTLLVKDNMPGQITLAIGDGANDVAMIQAAHLGIGIRGKEGQQAVLAADYALPRFAYLERLLLVHGRWSYNRIGTMVCYFFYKNIIFAFTLFWFNIWNGFSSQPLYDEGYQSLYNVCFTALPVIVFAVLDRDVEPNVVSAHPELYSIGQVNARFTGPRFAIFVCGAVFHSLLLFYLTVELLDLNVSNKDGQQQDFWAAGTAVLGNLVITVTAIIGLHTRSWHFSHVFVDVGSVVFWFVFLFVYHSLTPGQLGGLDSDDNVYDIVWDLGSSALYHLTTLLVVVMCCAPVMCYMMVKENYFPQIDDYYRRVVHSPDQYPGESLAAVDEAGSLRLNISTPPGGGDNIPPYDATGTKASAGGAVTRDTGRTDSRGNTAESVSVRNEPQPAPNPTASPAVSSRDHGAGILERNKGPS